MRKRFFFDTNFIFFKIRVLISSLNCQYFLTINIIELFLLYFNSLLFVEMSTGIYCTWYSYCKHENNYCKWNLLLFLITLFLLLVDSNEIIDFTLFSKYLILCKLSTHIGKLGLFYFYMAMIFRNRIHLNSRMDTVW